MTQPTRRLFSGSRVAALTAAPPAVQPVRSEDEATMMRRAVRDTFKGEREGLKRGQTRMAHTSVRLLPEDFATLEQMAEVYTRDTSFFIRVAVHMLADAYRRNPGALSQ